MLQTESTSRPGTPTWEALNSGARRDSTERRLLEAAAARGVDLRGRPDVALDLAAIGLTHFVWRNTTLDDAHAAGRIDDADMLAANIGVWRRLRSSMTPRSIDWGAMIDFISDPHLALPDGTPIRTAMRGFGWRAWRQRGRMTLVNAWAAHEAEGETPVVWRLAVSGMIWGKYWFGTPWWPFVVDDFISSLADPTSRRGMWLVAHPEIPRLLMALEDLRSRLIDAPDRLDHDTRAWCVALAMGMPEGDPLQAWREREDG